MEKKEQLININEKKELMKNIIEAKSLKNHIKIDEMTIENFETFKNETNSNEYFEKEELEGVDELIQFFYNNINKDDVVSEID